MITTTAPALIDGFPAETLGSRGRWTRKAGAGRFVVAARRSALAQVVHVMVFELNPAGVPQEGTLAEINPTTIGNLSSSFELETSGSRLMHFASDDVVVFSISGLFASIAYEQEMLTPQSFAGWGENSVPIPSQGAVVAIVDDATYDLYLQAFTVGVSSITEGALSSQRLIPSNEYILCSRGTRVGNSGDMVWMVQTEKFSPYLEHSIFVRATCSGLVVSVNPAVTIGDLDGFPLDMTNDPSSNRFAALWVESGEVFVVFGRLDGETGLVFGVPLGLGFDGDGWDGGAMVWQPGTDQVLIAASDYAAHKMFLLAVSCEDLEAIPDPDGPVELNIGSGKSACMEWDEESGRAVLAFPGDGGPITPQLNKPYIMTMVGDVPPPTAFWTNNTKQRESIPEA